MRINRFLVIKIAMMALAAGALTGCSDADLNSATAQRLRALAKAYSDYAVARGAGPADQAQLTKYVKEVPTVLLMAEVPSASAQEIFLSQRDGMPLRVEYKIPVGQILQKRVPLLARETTGKDGRCLAVYANGHVVCQQEPIPTEWQGDDE